MLSLLQNFPQVLRYALRWPRWNTLAALALVTAAFAPIQAVAAEGKTNVPAEADPAVVEFLMTSSAKDLMSSGGNLPTAIRAARIGYFAESGKGHFLLCGSFKSGPGPKAKWTHFATIKTSDYEQWLGGTAKAYCEQRTIKWYSGDHSAALMQKLRTVWRSAQ